LANSEKKITEQISDEYLTEEAESATDVQADVDAIMKKYDRESNVRLFSGIPATITKIILALFSIYTLYMNLFSTWDNRARKASFVGFIIILAFMVFPARKGKIKENHIPIYDILIALAGSAGFFYYVINFQDIVNRAGALTTLEIILGIVSTVVLFEACRRVVGIPIMVVAGAFIAYYCYFQLDLFGTLNVKTIVYNLFYTDTGILGTPINVCSTYIVLFVLFGTFLEVTGISQVFIQLANCIAGGSIGGPAKVAVISSALCGMVSGSSVANTVTTGSVTIPLMKKTGYKPEFAGAVEAAASTGGQIMPPIMGAAAFLMAEYMGISYGRVALMAILPAFLYFSGIFISVHLEAKKLGLKGLNKEDLPKLIPLLKNYGFLLAPLVVLIVLVIVTQALAVSAFLSIICAMAVSSVKRSKNKGTLAIKLIAIALGTIGAFYFGMTSPTTKFVALGAAIIIVAICQLEKNDAMDFGTFFKALSDGAKSCISVAIACAVAGIIAGVVTKTGVANLLNQTIGGVAEHSLFLALFLTMITCIVLGMGVPTTANFVIMATTCAPILINLNINPIAAYMFVFYFGIVADITPPVALAAYAGSAIAKSNPMKTGINASKLAIAAFIVPYIFVFSNEMLFIGDVGVFDVILIVISSIFGIYGVSAALEGHIEYKLNAVLRILIAAGGLCLIIPGLLTDIIGIAVVGGIFVIQKLTAKKHKEKLSA